MTEPIFTVTLFGDPVTKKNSQQIIRAGQRILLIPSKKYKEYESLCAKYLLGKMKEPIDYPINMKCVYYMRTCRKVDLVNLIEATCDIFTHYGIIADDNVNIVTSHEGSCIREIGCKDNPRAEIEITPADSSLIPTDVSDRYKKTKKTKKGKDK